MKHREWRHVPGLVLLALATVGGPLAPATAEEPRRDAAAEIMHRYGAVQVDHFGLGMTKAFPDNPEAQENKYDPDATF